MTDKKISELPTITGASLSGTDLIPIVDVSSNATSKVTRDEFFKNIPASMEILDSIVHSGDTNTKIRFPAVDTVTVETSGVERMRITSIGNVGIGTSTPSERLTVNGTQAFLTTFGQVEVKAGNTQSNLDMDFTEVTSADASVRFFRNTNTTGPKLIRFYRGDGSPNEDARIGVDGENSFFQVNGGNVGINETTPDYKLDVNGTFGFTPGASVTPVDNGDVVFELTNNTTLTVKAKGSDGVVRSGTITLA